MLPGFDTAILDSTATWNPLDKTAGATLSNGNLTASLANASQGARNVGPVNGGSVYIEAKIVSVTGGFYFGVCNLTHPVANYPGVDTNSVGYSPAEGAIYYNGAQVATGLATFAANDVIGMNVIVGTGVRFYKNGVAQNTGPTALPASGPFYFQAQNNVTGTFGITLLAAPQYPLAGTSYWSA